MSKYIYSDLPLNAFVPSDLYLICLFDFINQKEGAVAAEVIYGCIKDLDGKTSHSKLAMHASCFNEIKHIVRNRLVWIH